MENLYRTPKLVGSTLYKHVPITGKILVPYDPDGELSKDLRSRGLEVISNDSKENILDAWWWSQQKNENYDYVINCNYGLKDLNDYILKYSLTVSQYGAAFLDRISFLEPTLKRRDFLLSNPMSHLVILSPRPVYRALNNLKDSVTSAWFVFHHPEHWKSGTIISYAVSWSEPPDLTDVSKA